jgi:hypothetical protein
MTEQDVVGSSEFASTELAGDDVQPPGEPARAASPERVGRAAGPYVEPPPAPFAEALPYGARARAQPRRAPGTDLVEFGGEVGAAPGGFMSAGPVDYDGTPHGDEGESKATNWVERLGARRRLPEVFTQARPSLLEWLAEEWRTKTGWRRYWALFAVLVIKAPAGAIGDASEKPERLIPTLVVAVLVGTVLNQFPVLAVLVPNQLDFTEWF